MAPAGRRSVKVWDPLVRIAHWSLVVTVVGAWLTKTGAGVWHERIGYASLAIVAVRMVWGYIGPTHARFAEFVHSPARTLQYTKQVLSGRDRRYIGHNPLGSWMIVALIGCVTLVGLSGWLYTTDAYWGVEWVANLHAALTDLLIALVMLHLGGVLFASLRHRENLVGAMLHGRKRTHDVD